MELAWALPGLVTLVGVAGTLAVVRGAERRRPAPLRVRARR